MKTIELIDKYEIRQSNDPDYDPPSYIWTDNTGELIRCNNCKHQLKTWHEDNRMKEKGYWQYFCDLCEDIFTSHPVCGSPDDFCSSAEKRE